jgi:hypothetical protein
MNDVSQRERSGLPASDVLDACVKELTCVSVDAQAELMDGSAEPEPLLLRRESADLDGRRRWIGPGRGQARGSTSLLSTPKGEVHEDPIPELGHHQIAQALRCRTTTVEHQAVQLMKKTRARTRCELRARSWMYQIDSLPPLHRDYLKR